MENTPNRPSSWLARLAGRRIDLAIAAAVLLGFFYYKGGFRLLATLVISFALLVALIRLGSWLFSKRRSHRDN